MTVRSRDADFKKSYCSAQCQISTEQSLCAHVAPAKQAITHRQHTTKRITKSVDYNNINTIPIVTRVLPNLNPTSKPPQSELASRRPSNDDPPMKLISFIRAQTFAALFLAAFSTPAAAEKVLIAVAANFAGAAEKIAEDFSRETDHEALITTGSTGKLYSQITEGAPFDVLLSADTKAPARLETETLAIPGSVFTYAIGKLTLWSADPARIGPDPKIALTDPSLRFIAIANPDLAPYGQAAREVLQSMDLWDSLQPRIVMGQNIGQTFGLVQSGAAELGFIARSALDAPDANFGGSRWDVPEGLFTPLLQDAALLKAGADNPAAQAFLDYLGGPEARAIIVQFGYGVLE